MNTILNKNKLNFNYYIPKNKFIKTLTTVFQSGISLESV